MRHIFLYFVLVYAAMAAETTLPSLPKQEVYMDKSGWVHIFVRDLTTLQIDADGNWSCDAKLERISQEDYLRRICADAPLKDKLRLVAHLAQYWARLDLPPWEAVNITEEQWKDWIATGTLKTQEELNMAKTVQQAASAMAEIAAMKYYINLSSGVWHTDPNCVDNVGCITVSPFDVLKYENRKQCEKCGVK